jgi:hypothetical protein
MATRWQNLPSTPAKFRDDRRYGIGKLGPGDSLEPGIRPANKTNSPETADPRPLKSARPPALTYFPVFDGSATARHFVRMCNRRRGRELFITVFRLEVPLLMNLVDAVSFEFHKLRSYTNPWDPEVLPGVKSLSPKFSTPAEPGTALDDVAMPPFPSRTGTILSAYIIHTRFNQLKEIGQLRFRQARIQIRSLSESW